MLKFIIQDIKDIDSTILKAMYKFLDFALILFVISVYILFLYNTYPFSYTLLDFGLQIFRLSICIAISSFMSSFVIDKIRKLNI